MSDERARQEDEQLEAMFASHGWKVMLSQIDDWQVAIAAQWRSLKPENLAFEQGRYDGLAQIANYESTRANVRETNDANDF